MTAKEFIVLLTEDDIALLDETGNFFIGFEVEREVVAGGKKKRRGVPFTVPADVVFPHEPERDWEEEEALLLCGAL